MEKKCENKIENEFEKMDPKVALEKEIRHLKQVLNNVQEKLQILENRSDRSTGYTMHLLQKLMTIVEKKESESKNPFRFIKDVFKTVKNSCVWAMNQLANPQDYQVDDETFRNIVNLNFDDIETSSETGSGSIESETGSGSNSIIFEVDGGI